MHKPITVKKWRNITISGRVASGATTLSRSLAKLLNWKLFNGGELYREYAKEKKIPLEKTSRSDDKYHLDLDNLIKNKLKNESSIIIESWLAGFDAQKIDHIFKIFTTCSDDAVRIDRLVNRESMTIDEAKIHLKIREEENLSKWRKIYNIPDIWNSNLYDLLIDTYTNGPEETLDIVLKTIKYYKK